MLVIKDVHTYIRYIYNYINQVNVYVIDPCVMKNVTIVMIVSTKEHIYTLYTLKYLFITI